jgi:hypothetical protein
MAGGGLGLGQSTWWLGVLSWCGLRAGQEAELCSLCCAALCCAVLRCAALCCAVLRCAALCCAVLRWIAAEESAVARAL